MLKGRTPGTDNLVEWTAVLRQAVSTPRRCVRPYSHFASVSFTQKLETNLLPQGQYKSALAQGLARLVILLWYMIDPECSFTLHYILRSSRPALPNQACLYSWLHSSTLWLSGTQLPKPPSIPPLNTCSTTSVAGVVMECLDKVRKYPLTFEVCLNPSKKSVFCFVTRLQTGS